MIARTFTLASLLFLGASAALSGAAAAADLPSASACTPGREAQLSKEKRQARGETPLSVEGAVTVSPREARCLMKKLGADLTVVAAVGDQRKLPGAIPMPWAAITHPDALAKLAEELGKLTRGRRTQPVLVYCHHNQCALSQYAVANMVQVGYSKVYWLREGMEGWRQAGYAFEGETEKDPAERYASLLQDCSYNYSGTDVAIGVASLPSNEVEPALEAKGKRAQQARKRCLELLTPEVEDHKGRKADLAQRIAGSDAEVARSLKSAWAEFDANPAKFLAPVLDDASAASASGMLERARAIRPVSASCGSFNYQIPSPLNNAVLDVLSQRTEAYRACLDKVGETFDGAAGLYTSDFAVYVERAERLHPYTCSMKRGRNCLPDEVWGRVGRVATRDNLKTIEQAVALEKRLAGEAAAELQRVNSFVDSVNVRVAQSNAAAEARDSQRSDSGYGGYYAPPQPPATPVRRASNASASGIR